MLAVKVSIIIPVYNVAPYIVNCLQSVVQQTYRGPLECLLVDDCGTDNSMAFAKEFVATYRGRISFRVIQHTQNRGLSAARNTGLAAASGAYVYFLDSDDEITPDCIEQLVTYVSAATPYDFVIGAMQMVGERQQTSPMTLAHGAELRGNVAIRRAYFQQQWYTMACGKLCNRAFLQRNGLQFKEGLLHEDELWSFQLACTAQSMRVVQRPTYIYKVRQGSITTDGVSAERHAWAWMQIIEQMVDFTCQHSFFTPGVVKFLFDETYSTWRLFRWVGISATLRKQLTLRCRHSLSRIPYALRCRVSFSSIRCLLRYANTLLPLSWSDAYYRMLQINK